MKNRGNENKQNNDKVAIKIFRIIFFYKLLQVTIY